MTNPSAPTSDIVVYWRPGCPYSIKLRMQLRLTRLKYTEINIWESPDAAAYVRSVADGNETVPTVDVAGHPIVNPSLRQVLSAARAHAPPVPEALTSTTVGQVTRHAATGLTT